ncbi:HAMP domain-containing protein [Desulfosporosinus fructosivorans]|uniref:HAMP domain-containing protein n=1 Tax=Desulfosporosinus fructosivorans TaxID=2018669 RepID=A0A4Z0R8C3_9FIRM|nr:methyl-accepting chemotaxis protein [Desulfosporosinus fructosivorans]TGE39078.1 HAMP domain-containing protein [Desulfosporosinus fructosivorans]
MKWFYNMKISAKLISSFILIAILAGVVGVVGIISLQSTSKNFGTLFEVYGIATADVAEIGLAFQEERSVIRDVLFHNADYQKSLDTLKEKDAIIDAGLVKIEKNMQTAQGREVYNVLSDNLLKYKDNKSTVFQLVATNQKEQAITLFYGVGSAPTVAVADAINTLFKLKIEGGLSKTTEYDSAATNAIQVMMAVLVFAVLIAIALGIFISKIISKPIVELVSIAEKIADGDLDVAIEAKTRDEIGTLSSAFKRMADNLNEVMTNFNSASEQVASGSRQVSASSMALSQGATEQASSIEELTASIEEISTQTMLNAQNASQANELAEAARENAIQGNQQMKEMLQAMEEINDASGNIFKIIKVIDEIAFQTNILALNAAVEAARAGQHGKGFAVVAEEVRNLAARSANAAKETTALIEGSTKKVEGGTKIANDTALALNKIVEGVSKATSLVAQIATASNEQALGLNQVNQGIIQVSSVVQTNSATSEESAAASEELSSQAELLREQVRKFKLRKTTVSSFRGLDDLNPEVLQMLEEMSRRKKGNKNFDNQGYAEAAAASNKPKIYLSDNEFGKY